MGDILFWEVILFANTLLAMLNSSLSWLHLIVVGVAMVCLYLAIKKAISIR